MSKILSYYQFDNQKTINNLKRIFNQGHLQGTGKIVILAIDHGFEHGPDETFAKNPVAYDPEYHFRLADKSGCSALTAPLGFLEIGAKAYADKIPLILKLNSSDSLYKDKNNNMFSALTASVEDAVRLGCVGVGFTIYPGSKFSRQIYEQAQAIIKQAKEQGLIVVIWAYPRGEKIFLKQQIGVDILAYAVQIACQLGAHFVKTKIPISDNPNLLENKIKQIMKSAFDSKRIVLFSGGEIKDKEDLYQETRSIQKGGGFGSVLGRNIIQRPEKEALEVLDKIMKIYKDK